MEDIYKLIDDINLQKLDNLGKDLYDDDFWKDFDYGERG